MNYNSSDEVFREEILKLNNKPSFSDFDTFIIQDMGIDVGEYPISIEHRREAFRIFRRETRRENLASFSTMKRWFGIGKASRPSRTQVGNICLALGADVKRAETYLTIGLGQTSFIYNSLREIIWLYCLENTITCDGYDRILRKLVDLWTDRVEFVLEDHSSRIKEEFNLYKKASEDDFVRWLYQNRIFFNEYNEKIMNVLYRYRKTINEQIKKSAMERLEQLLRETDFDKWLKQRKSKSDRYSLIKRYVHSVREGKRNVSEDEAKNILELSKIAYSKKEKLSYVYSEVFPTKNAEKYIHGGKKMSMKRLSDIYNMPELRRKELDIRQICLLLAKLDENSSCPAWFEKWYQSFSGEEKNMLQKFEISSNLPAGVAYRRLKEFQKEHHRRCIRINRNDILPLLHYVSQHNYMNRIDKNRKEYDDVRSKNDFVRLAKRVLKECGMENVSDQFGFDRFFLACYQPTDMYSFSDGLDVL